MLNREAASNKNKPAEIIKNLPLREGNSIADIGSGGGYFTIEFAKLIGEEANVYAVDMNSKSLDFIEQEVEKEGLNNVKTVLADKNGFSIPEKSVDILFLRNVFHHLPNPVDYFKNVTKFLKTDGKIAIVDYKKKGFSFTGLFGHFTPENLLIETMEKAGFKIFKQFDFLTDQSFIIFQKIKK
jgi:arsenite methyltransferase